MEYRYQLLTNKGICDKVQLLRQTEIRKLQLLGFDNLYFYAEIVPKLGMEQGVAGMQGIFNAMEKEEFELQKDLSVNICQAALTCRRDPAYAFPFSLGVKFYTVFTDGTFIISANFQLTPIKDDAQKIYKFGGPASIEEAWQWHKAWKDQWVADGRQVDDTLSFDIHVSLAKREIKYMTSGNRQT